jgi:hypothetical protein
MENIVTLILIFIALGSILRKFKAQKKTKPGAPPPGGGWVTRLNVFLTDLKNQIEQQTKESTTGPSGWDQLLDGDEGFSSPSDADEAGLDDLVFEEAQTPPHTKKMPPAAPVRAQTSRSDKTRCVPGVPRRKAVHACNPSDTSMATSRADLRKAVIWAEILAPPVALRDQFGGRR